MFENAPQTACLICRTVLLFSFNLNIWVHESPYNMWAPYHQSHGDMAPMPMQGFSV